MLNFISFATLALAAPSSSVGLTIESSDSSLSGKGISAIHFGAGLDGALISNEPTYYNLNTTTGNVFQAVEIANGPIPFVFGELGNVLVSEAGGVEIPVVVDGSGYLTVNGSSSVFYACDKLAWDPYGYTSPENKGVGIYSSTDTIPSECTPINIKASQSL